MFAVVKAGQVTREIKGGPFNADNGIQYPANIFSLWSIDDLINIGIYPVEETSNNLDPRVERETGKVEFVINNKSVSKLKIKSDVHTIDPETGKAVGVLTRSQRKAFDKKNQAALEKAAKDKLKIRTYRNKGNTYQRYG